MPRSAEPSAAARQLVQDLADRGLTVSCRTIEDWAARGLAPGPARRSLGRGHGTASEYPPGAVDQYAAVASVMRRGLPWQVSVLKLFVRGHLPTDENLVRLAYHDMLAADAADPAEDALDYAERIAAQAATTRAARPYLRAFARNLRRSAQILEPGTDVGNVVTGVVATLNLAVIGEPDWSADALTEMMAAFGLPVGQLNSDDRSEMTRFIDRFLAEVLTGPVLARVAAQTPLRRIQSVLPQARDAAAEALPTPGTVLPRPSADVADVLTALCALMLIRIEDLGGDDAITELASRALPAPVRSAVPRPACPDDPSSEAG